MRTILTYLVALACLLGTNSAAIAHSEKAWPLDLREQMLRLAEVDWRLRKEVGEYCPRLASGIGVMVDHSGAYSSLERMSLMRTLRLGDLPQVTAVVTGSPAALAGLRPGDEIVTIDDISMTKALRLSPEKSLFADEVMDMIAALPAGNPTTILLRRGKMLLRKTVVPIRICSARTMLATERSLEAYSDSNDLAITSALIEFTESDDELALVIGHELAHVLMNSRSDKSRMDPQATERKADILGALIAHCAGYDMAHAAAFWSRFDKQDKLRKIRLATHPSSAQREELLLRSIADFACPVTLPTK